MALCNRPLDRDMHDRCCLVFKLTAAGRLVLAAAAVRTGDEARTLLTRS